MKLLNICSVLVTLVITACVKTPYVERVVDDNWSGNGVLYALPRTAIATTFDISKIDFAASRCKDPTADTLKRLDLERKDVSNDKRVAYSVHSGAISARAVPDKNKVFAMHIPKSTNWANTAMITNLNALGILDSVETNSTSKALEIGAKTLELGLNVGFSLMGAGISNKDDKTQTDCATIVEEYEDLKKAKQDLFKGPGYPSKEAYETLTEVIDLAMASKQSYFIGEQTIQKDTVTCDLSPDSEGDTVLFQVNVNEGFVLSSQCKLAGDNVPLVTSLKTSKSIMMTIEKVQNPSLLQADFAQLYKTQAASAEPGFYYNVPVDAFVSITGHSKAKVNKTKLVMPQLGEVAILPRIKGNSPLLNVTLHPETGALKTLKVTNDAADMPSLIGTVNTGVTSYFTTRKALDDKEAAEAEKTDELTVLTREKSILEMRLAIITIQDALAQLEQ